MYKTPKMHQGQLKINNTIEGETIENKVIRLIQNKEPIKDGTPIIYTDRKDGVNPAYNIRTDRWEIATDAMDRLLKQKAAKTEGIGKTAEQEAITIELKKDDGKPKPIQGEAS